MSDFGRRDAAALLALLGERGVGPATAISRAESGLIAGELDLERIADLDAEIADLAESGVQTLGYFDADFPKRLREIPGPPAVIYVRGRMPEEDRASLAVIGTREPTRFGRTAAEKLTRAAAARGAVIISGLAIGIDAIAHEAALKEGAPTVAILGSGLDSVSPRRHRGLAERIVDEGGALLSEHPFGVVPAAHTLVARNRLQAGIADSLLICQSGLRGGSMHTVRFAAEQNKTVWVPVPHEENGPNEGLVVLLEHAAEELPALVPAWRGKERLAARVGGGAPLGHPVTADGLEAWVESVSEVGPPAHEPETDARLF